MKRFCSDADEWLETLGLGVEPFLDSSGTCAAWLRACHRALLLGEKNEKRAEWRGFIALLAHDPEVRTALAVAWARCPDEGAHLAQVNYDGFAARLAGAAVVPRLRKLWERRARRLSGRETGVAGPIARPTDQALLEEGTLKKLGRPKKVIERRK